MGVAGTRTGLHHMPLPPGNHLLLLLLLIIMLLPHGVEAHDVGDGELEPVGPMTLSGRLHFFHLLFLLRYYL